MFVLFYNVYKENMLKIGIEDGSEAPWKPSLYIYFTCLFGCLSIHLYPINVKKAEPIGPKFCVGHRVTPEKDFGWSKLKKNCLQQISLNLDIPRIYFRKSAHYFVFVQLIEGGKANQTTKKRLKINFSAFFSFFYSLFLM